MAEKSGSPAAAAQQEQSWQQFLSTFIAEIVKSPVNLALVAVIAILVYKIVKSRTRPEEPMQEVKKLPKMRRDFAIEELTKYDGKGPDGRLLVAVNGSVYDVTRGAKFYGPGESPGPASILPRRRSPIERCFFPPARDSILSIFSASAPPSSPLVFSVSFFFFRSLSLSLSLSGHVVLVAFY